MSFLVFCIFELKDAKHDDYMYAYMDLAALGLRKTIRSDTGPSFKLPGASVMGTLEGRSVEEVRSTIAKKIQAVFKTRGLRGDFFVVASADWACAGESN
jgi:hypothetical protein